MRFTAFDIEAGGSLEGPYAQYSWIEGCLERPITPRTGRGDHGQRGRVERLLARRRPRFIPEKVEDDAPDLDIVSEIEEASAPVQDRLIDKILETIPEELLIPSRLKEQSANTPPSGLA